MLTASATHPDDQSVTAQLAPNGVATFARAAGNLNAVAGGNKETFKSVAMVMTQTAGVATDRRKLASAIRRDPSARRGPTGLGPT